VKAAKTQAQIAIPPALLNRVGVRLMEVSTAILMQQGALIRVDRTWLTNHVRLRQEVPGDQSLDPPPGGAV
jgi:hypothetical protein